MNKLAITISIIVTAVLFTTTTALAHVVIDSKQGGGKAVFHISPADDPIAGKESTLYFDVEASQTDGAERSASLDVVNSEGSTVTVPAAISGQTVSVKYTFPKGGSYTLNLTVTSTDLAAEVLQFSFDQTVRGNNTAAPQTQNDSSLWLLSISLVLVVITVTLAAAKRKSIADSLKLPRK